MPQIMRVGRVMVPLMFFLRDHDGNQLLLVEEQDNAR